MAQGVALPLRITPKGGLAVNKTNVAAIIAAELLPSSSANPFDARDGYVVADAAFSAADGRTDGSLRRFVAEVFARREREGRAVLETVTIDHERVSSTGELVVAVTWRNLETGEGEVTEMEL